LKEENVSEIEELRQQLIDYYRVAFSELSVCYTLPVSQEEVEIIKQLLLLAGGKETQEVQIECWNIASADYPKICLAIRPDFPFYRDGWNKRE